MTNLRDYADQAGLLVLADRAALDRYDHATTAFSQGGLRSDLLRELMALGMPAAQARWHAQYRGNRMMAIYG